MTALNNAALQSYYGTARLPNYDRSTVTAGILHLGIGAFHRAHQAVYIDDLLKDAPDWGILGASLRRADTKLALGPQDGLYTLAVRDGEAVRTRIIGSVLRVLDWTQDADEILACIADPQIRIISLTVTEKGYCRTLDGGDLDRALTVVQDDLTGRVQRSVPGILVAGLEQRRRNGAGPVTVLSCDNLRDNGPSTRRVVRQFAQISNPELVPWIDANVTFPATMVDRITPATIQADTDAINRLSGLSDAWPITTEPFCQWVIEDDFAAGRPAFEAVGVQMVADVRPFEAMKLRILNGAHSTLAYAGGLMGYEFVAEAVADPVLSGHLTRTVIEEVIPTLDLPAEDLSAYWDTLLARFANKSLHHRLDQIAQDGTQKLPQRLLAPIRDNLVAGRSVTGLVFGLATWIVWIERRRTEGLDLVDPMAKRLFGLAEQANGDIDHLVQLVLTESGLFGDLLSDDKFCRQVSDQAQKLNT
jgi:fructuronate reductase